MSLKNIALHASYFGDNFGDTLFVKQYVQYLTENSDVNTTLLFPSKRVLNEVAGLTKRSGWTGIIKSEAVVFIGGGYFGERKNKKLEWHIRFIYRYISVALLALLFRKKIFFVGVGAGPLSFKITRLLVKFVVNKSSGFVARDEISYDFLLSIGVKENLLYQSVDSVLGYLFVDEKVDQIDRILLHLPLLNAESDSLGSLIHDLKQSYPEAKFLYFTDFHKPSFKTSVLKELTSALPDLEIVDYNGVDDTIDLIKSVDLVVSVKLHVIICAAALGKKVISLFVHQKTQRFLNQLNWSDVGVQFESIGNSDVSQKLVAKTRDFPYKIPKAAVELSKRNLVLLDSFIDEAL